MSENIINNDSPLSNQNESEQESVVLDLSTDIEPQNVVEQAPEIQEEQIVVEATEEPVVVEVAESEEPAVDENVISSPKRSRSTRGTSTGSTENNVVASNVPSAKTSKASKADSAEKEEKVAVHSTKNVTWSGVGKVYRGYNIVSKDAAEKWLTRSHIRLATPEEVAKEFGK